MGKNCMNKLIRIMCLLPLLIFASGELDFDEDWAAAISVAGPKPFTVTFITGTPPTNVVLHANYTGPANANLALYDSGNGVWHEYTSRDIPVVGSYVAFMGDWRTAAGTYASMFKDSFADSSYTCTFSGAFYNYPTHDSAYREMFYGCTRVVAIIDNPIPNLKGAPAASMLNGTYCGMTGVVEIPSDFLNTSGLYGTAAGYMLSACCYNMSSVKSLPDNFADLSGVTGNPGWIMCINSFRNMTAVTNAHIFYLSGDLNLTTNNISEALSWTYANMTKWAGKVMWGTNVLVDVIVPRVRSYSFFYDVAMPGYADIDANWK